MGMPGFPSSMHRRIRTNAWVHRRQKEAPCDSCRKCPLTLHAHIRPARMDATGPSSAVVYVQILYNAARGRYVLLFHADTASFDYNVVGVAVSGSISGPYTFVRTFHPDGLNSLDMGVFQVCSSLPLPFCWRLSAN